jgi:hypothetical protein
MILYPGMTELDYSKLLLMSEEECKKAIDEHYESLIAAGHRVTERQERRAAERAAEAAQQPPAPQPE